ncbi:uncharacterized protein LOC142591339 [Dermacentor variabilis]|uniref:uncharacterized protein LOC142591339 n=1 Tax=Dermacentor variabilis TaxID=34621 RepID=UPI003F5C0F54
MAVDVSRLPPTASSCLVLLLLGAALGRDGRGRDRYPHELRRPREGRPPKEHGHGTIPTPYECPWFTKALSNCSNEPPNKWRIVPIVHRTDKARYSRALLLCMTQRSVEAPDKIFCTDKESVSILTSCVEHGLAKHSRVSREEAREFLDKMGRCLLEFHHEKMNMRRRKGRAHRRYSP